MELKNWIVLVDTQSWNSSLKTLNKINLEYFKVKALQVIIYIYISIVDIFVGLMGGIDLFEFDYPLQLAE
jgi:hypothetical protein